MKTKIFLALSFFFLTGTLSAQNFAFGIKGGANMGKIDGQSFKNEFKLGYQVGVFSTIGLGNKVALQPEVLFNQINVDTSHNFSDIYNDFSSNVKGIQLKEILIPLMLNINLTKNLALQAGPQFSVVIDQNKSLLENGKDAFRSGNFAIAGGLQASLSKFRIYGRFTGGMTNLDNVGNNDSWKVQNIQLGIGLAL
ncbi:MAG: PorT family protein [Chitinophagaceae bacterium]|nr:PorT family protein [Chitinophagaceae bacterium]